MSKSDDKTSDAGHFEASDRSIVAAVETSHVEEKRLSTNDLEKQGNVKSDDSDGRVDWYWRQILATLSLCCLYVGACIFLVDLRTPTTV